MDLNFIPKNEKVIIREKRQKLYGINHTTQDKQEQMN